MLAREQADYETLGRDLVAMCVNDVLTMGAEPLFFLDYMGWPQLDLKNATSTLKGISDACRESGCALIGKHLPHFCVQLTYQIESDCSANMTVRIWQAERRPSCLASICPREGVT
jgi:phosphoribosylformylglycinamidine cyclo-ligase